MSVGSYGYCQCGCGQKTRLAPQTHRARGWVKGQPLKYVRGHSTKLKIRDQEIIKAYEKTGSIWQAASLLGCSAEAVRKRLIAANIDRGGSRYTEAEKGQIKKFYLDNPDDLPLAEFARILGRTKSSISMVARRMGLTRRDRPFPAASKRQLSKSIKESYKGREHPRGASGLKHSEASRKVMSEKSRERAAEMTAEDWKLRGEKSVRTRQLNNTPWHTNVGGGGYANVKRGYRVDLGIFVRSGWEANWARYLKFLANNPKDKLQWWEYEPDTFWFEGIRRGIVSYTPDFKLHEKGKEPYYQEVKGRMDNKSKTKLKRMAKYYPDVRVDVIDEKAYRAVEKQMAPLIPEWE